MSPLYFFALLLLCGYSHAFYWNGTSAPDQGQGNDDFYTPPAGFESTSPGTVLKSRFITPGFLGIFPTSLSHQTYQLLYRTTTVSGKPTATVTTVFVPWNASKDRMVAYDVFEDSSASHCAPSRNVVLDGSASSNLLVQVNILLLQAYLLKGWIVAVADSLGPDSAFGVGKMQGMMILDSIRATKSFASVGLQQDAMIVGSGYSGGAIGVGWAAGLKEAYANELNVVGWAMGGTPSNLTGTFVNIDGQLFAGFIPAAIAGISSPSAYPHLATTIDRVATAEAKSGMDFVRSHCATDDIVHFAYKHFQDPRFSSLGDQLLYEQEVVDVLNDNLMGRNLAETPQVPVLMYHSTADGVIPYSNASALRDTWCENGASVHFKTYLESGHGGLSIRGLVDVLDFVERAFDGTTERGCIQATVQPTAFTVPFLLEPLFIGLLNILNTLGPGDSGIQGNRASALRTTVSTTVKMDA